MLATMTPSDVLPTGLLAGLRAGRHEPGLRRVARIAAQFAAWPILVKAGLLAGFALAASVQQLVAG